MANAVVGRVLLIPKGNYSASVSYNMLDLVRYDNKSWVCKQTCTGQAPAENTYWFLLTQDGVDGIVGSIWYTGTGITGTSTTPTIFSGSGVTLANVTDMYLNSSTGDVYQCTTGGDASTAEWVLIISLGSYNNYVLPTASTSVKGGVKIGNGLVIDSEIVRVDKYTFANVAVATADFATYTATLTGEADLATAGYDYKAHIASTGVTADHEANVVFGAIEADSGNYASIATTEAGYVNIYAKAVPSSAITIPTIDCTYKGV